jgi:hypothetical protein
MQRMVLSITLAGLLVGSLVGQTRYRQFTRKFDKTPDQAKVISAGYLGTSGTEWLVSGGFQPDGTVVIVGVTLGPTFQFGTDSPRVTLLGKDGTPPPAPEPTPRLDKTGKPLLDKKTKKPLVEPFAWNHPHATAFVARLSSDLKTIKSVSRFPWRAGGATSAVVDDRGCIYLTGPGGPNIAALANNEELQAKATGMKIGSCEIVYVAKLSSTGDRILWTRTLKGISDAPALQLTRTGMLQFQSADVRVLSLDGKQESVTVIPGGITTRQGSTSVRTTAIHPRDGSFVRAGEHHWRTGREPYRDPILHVHKADGSLLYELYNWDGPFVGLDNLRLVSDSAIRRVRFDEEGNLVLYAWSDGGNSVMVREPNDIRRESPKWKGLGMSAWGAGVLSCAYIIKIETTNWKVAGGTLWLAYLDNRDRPNSIWVDSLGFARDGSICLGGRSAWGLIQTGNALSKTEPTGPYVSVLSRDCSSLRFSSVMPGTGEVDVRDGERWGIVSGTCNGKTVVLFLGSANQGAPGETKYAGGHTDGYMLMLDLSTLKK